jgi:hypothetical protein
MVGIKRPWGVEVSAHVPPSGTRLSCRRSPRGCSTGRARQAVAPRHEQHVAGVKLAEDAAERTRSIMAPLATSLNTLPRPVFSQDRNLSIAAIGGSSVERPTNGISQLKRVLFP